MHGKEGIASAARGSDARYATLDGLRGVAAAMVAIFHLQQRLMLPSIDGYLAVDLFFVLSGFVLTQVYVDRFTAGLGALRFTLQRCMRFYPLYMTGFLLGVLALLTTTSLDADVHGAVQTTAALLFGAVLLPTPASATLYPLNGAAWSLFFELAVNLLFALWLWRWSSRALLAVIAAASVWIVAKTGDPLYLNFGWKWVDFGAGCARTLFSFSIGILICRLVGARTRQQSPAALILLLFAVVPMLEVIGNRSAWDLAAVTVLFPTIVLLGTLLEPPAWARGALGGLGALSFPLYAVHWPIAALMAPWLMRLPFAAAAAAFLAVAYSVAYAAQRLIDQPAQRFAKGWLREPVPADKSPTNAAQACGSPA